MSFEDYYNQRVKLILDSVVLALTQDPLKIFNWADLAFFNRWFKDLSLET